MAKLEINALEVNEEIKQDLMAILMDVDFGYRKNLLDAFEEGNVETQQDHLKHPIYSICLTNEQNERCLPKIGLPEMYCNTGDDEEEDHGCEARAVYYKDHLAISCTVAYGEYTDDDNDAYATVTIFLCNNKDFLKEFIDKEIQTLNAEELNAKKSQLTRILLAGYDLSPTFLSDFLKENKGQLQKLIAEDLTQNGRVENKKEPVVKNNNLKKV